MVLLENMALIDPRGEKTEQDFKLPIPYPREENLFYYGILEAFCVIYNLSHYTLFFLRGQ